MTTPTEDALCVLCVAPNREVAEKLARLLVEARAAACVNVLGDTKSFYRWKGELHVDDEVQLVIKTTRAEFDEIEKLVRANHPYEVPELIALPIVAGSADYLRWLVESTG